ncbi:MAG: hypothetical protein LDL24_10555 [Treponema sp.]|nr:hypothetical protein [Treponema sp.]
MDYELIKLVEPIRRARGDFLYTYRGTRLVDLWKQGGRAILGHGKSQELTCLKNTLSRGVWMPAPHPGMRHLEKALGALFPGKTVRVYRGLHRALYHIGCALKQPVRREDIGDPANPWLFSKSGNPAADRSPPLVLWRPWTPAVYQYETEIIVPVLPVAWSEEIAAVLLPDSADPHLPPSDLISPVLAEYAQRALYDLKRALETLALPHLPKTMRALEKSSIWKGSGLYWFPPPDLGGDAYKQLFLQFLEAGFLLPPDLSDPLILPWQLSPGLDVKLGKLLSFAGEA